MFDEAEAWPLLSVVTPAYNERDYILEIIRRVHAVPLAEEIIVVNDASVDGTSETLVAVGDPPIKVIRKGKRLTGEMEFLHCHVFLNITSSGTCESLGVCRT